MIYIKNKNSDMAKNTYCYERYSKRKQKDKTCIYYIGKKNVETVFDSKTESISRCFLKRKKYFLKKFKIFFEERKDFFDGRRRKAVRGGNILCL